VAALDGERGLIETERLAVLDVIAAEDAREPLAASMASGFDILVQSLGLTPDVVQDPGFVARSVLAGYEAEAYDEEQATVRIWGTSIFFAEGRQAISGVWSTETATLRWERDDWRLVAFDSEEGPTPPDTPAPVAPGIGERINSFDRFVHVPPPR
jgi:hypothetical protein